MLLRNVLGIIVFVHVFDCFNAAFSLIDIEKPKDLKKTIATKTNLLVLFASSLHNREVIEVKNLLKTVDGSFAIVDCSDNILKKQVCKKTLPEGSSYVLRHYKDGTFNKVYDRQLSKNSMQYFLKDPTGEIPFVEETSSADVVHIADVQQFDKLLKRDKSFLMMFYTNWCGYCKRLKPKYSQLASEMKGKRVLAAMDMEKTENNVLMRKYNVSGFPTMIWFDNGVARETIEDDGLAEFLEDPDKPREKKQHKKDEQWVDDPNTEIVHLTNQNFEIVLKDEKSAIVLFYANWCGHCKNIKPKYEAAAVQMKNKNISGMLAALDAVKESDTSSKFGVKGFPTLKYFEFGEFKHDVEYRETDLIVKFMENPEKPPVVEKEVDWDEEETLVEFLTEESFKPFLKKKKHVLVMFYAPWCGHCKRTKPEFNKAAEKFKDNSKVELAAVDCTKHSGVCSAFEVRGYPTIKYFNYLKNQRDYTGDRKSDDFINFLNDPDKPSQPTKRPEEKIVPFTSDRVKLLDDKTFDVTLKQEKSVLVMFFTNYCIHCKNLKPVYSEAADKATEVGVTTIFAAVDCGANNSVCQKFKIDGYPTVKFFKSGKFFRDYSSERKSEAFLNFLRTNTEDLKEEL